MFSLKKLFFPQSSKKSNVEESIQLASGDGGMTDEELSAEENENSAANSRRSFILKVGKYSAYTAPVIYTLLAPKGSIYASSGMGTST